MRYVVKNRGRKFIVDANSHKGAVKKLRDKLIESGSEEAFKKNIATEIKAGKDPKQAAAIAYSVQRENDAELRDSKIVLQRSDALDIFEDIEDDRHWYQSKYNLDFDLRDHYLTITGSRNYLEKLINDYHLRDYNVKIVDAEIPHITKEQWNKIPKDYKTIDPKTGKKMAFAGSLGIAPGGTTLLTEGMHFIIDSEEKNYTYIMFGTTGEKRVDNLTKAEAEHLLKNNKLLGYDGKIVETKTLKDAKQEYRVNYHNNYTGRHAVDYVEANNVKEALRKFGKDVALRGDGTANINVHSISPNEGYQRIYGKLSELLKNKDFQDSVEDDITNQQYFTDDEIVTKNNGTLHIHELSNGKYNVHFESNWNSSYDWDKNNITWEEVIKIKNSIKDSKIKDAYYNIGGYESETDKMLKRDISKAKSMGLKTYVEEVDGSYQLTVEGPRDKVEKIVENYFAGDVSSIGDRKVSDGISVKEIENKAKSMKAIKVIRDNYDQLVIDFDDNYYSIPFLHWLDSKNVKYYTADRYKTIYIDLLDKNIKDKSVFSEETMNSMQEGIEKDYESMENRLEKLHDTSAPKEIEDLPIKARQELRNAKEKGPKLLEILSQLQDIVNKASVEEKAEVRYKAEKILADLKKQFGLERETYIKLDSAIEDERLSPMTYSKLKELGYDQDDWKDLTQEQANELVAKGRKETTSRETSNEENSTIETKSTNKNTEKYEVPEEYDASKWTETEEYTKFMKEQFKTGDPKVSEYGLEFKGNFSKEDLDKVRNYFDGEGLDILETKDGIMLSQGADYIDDQEEYEEFAKQREEWLNQENKPKIEDNPENRGRWLELIKKQFDEGELSEEEQKELEELDAVINPPKTEEQKEKDKEKTKLNNELETLKSELKPNNRYYWKKSEIKEKEDRIAELERKIAELESK